MSTNLPNQRVIFKGDDTGAFGNNFVTITVKNPLLYPVSKLEFVVNGGCAIAPKVFTDENYFQQEETIVSTNFSKEESKNFNYVNTGNLIAYDMAGKRYTCPQSLIFKAKNGVICHE